MTPDLTRYASIVVNTSAGKDSQAMAEVVVAAARERGVLGRVLFVHCDLGEMEWPGTKALAAEHAAHYGVPFIVVKRPGRTLLEEVRDRGRWPDSLRRYCTSYYKRDEVKKVHVRLAKQARTRGWMYPLTLDCLGMRADESRARSKLAEMATMVRNRRRRVDRWLPVFGLTAEAVWAVNAAAGTRHHPAYDLGMPRLSCCFCIFANRKALVLAGKHNPELLDRYVAVEAEIGHTFTHRLSLATVRDEVRAGGIVGPVPDWEM